MKIRSIKILSVIILTISAVVGILFDFKDTDRHLTTFGFIALIFAVISGITTIITEILEFKSENEELRLEDIKENERKKTLAEIQRNIISSNSALIPFRLFYTLKNIAKTNEIEEAVANSVAILSDVNSDILKFIGTARIGGPQFNFEEESPKNIRCTIDDKESIDSLIENRKLLKLPSSIYIEIYTKEADGKPDIILKTEYETAHGVGRINEVRIYDNIFYQDIFSQHWVLSTSQMKVFGVSDLLRSRINIKARFFISERTNDNEYPRFTNLLLYFGDNPINILSFNLEELISKQISYRENEEEGIFKFQDEFTKQIFQQHIVEFEINITDEIYNNQIKQFV